MRMNKLCCISLTLAARIIGTFGLSTSILMINVLMTDFFSRKEDDKFLTTIETWALLGLNWTQFVKNTEIPKQVQLVLICFLGYSFLYLFASAFLALGTVSRKPKFTLPWLYIQMVSIIDQTIALCVHLTDPPRYDAFDRSNWYIPLSSFYLVVTVYFWLIVYSARQDWFTNVREPYDTFDIFNLDPGTTAPITDSNVPKTPSFLAQNLSIFESPQPPIPIKYDVV